MDPIEKCQKIDEIIKKLEIILHSDEIIPEKRYIALSGEFSGALKALINEYFSLDEILRTSLSPYILFYRQLQHYLVFILRFPTILMVPHHSEILQTLNLIQNKQNIILDFYTEYAKFQYDLLHGDFSKQLDGFLSKQGKKEENKTHSEFSTL